MLAWPFMANRMSVLLTIDEPYVTPLLVTVTSLLENLRPGVKLVHSFEVPACAGLSPAAPPTADATAKASVTSKSLQLKPC
jgi:hypothetical protein